MSRATWIRRCDHEVYLEMLKDSVEIRIHWGDLWKTLGIIYPTLDRAIDECELLVKITFICGCTPEELLQGEILLAQAQEKSK